VSDNGNQENPSNPYWPYVISRIGRVDVSKSGKYSASLKLDQVPAGQKFGVTLVSIRLVPVR
jgi:hypothetical protein